MKQEAGRLVEDEMTKRMRYLTVVCSIVPATGSVHCAGAPWNNHARPFSFTFGNDIDTHQQTRTNRNGDPFGFFNIVRTGDTTADGMPVVTHTDCNATPDCKVGWIITA